MYKRQDLNDLSSITKTIDEDFTIYPANDLRFSMGINDILSEYAVRAANLKSMLWILQIPTIVMLAFYLFMVSQLNVEQEKNEIAVFKSCGASSGQIFAIYAMEAGVLGLVTFIAAPFIGMLLCSFLGVSNGFLEFVNRTGLSVKLSLDAFIYALLAVVIFFITTMLPIIPASKLSIVTVSYTHLHLRLHEVGIASNRRSAYYGEYVPGPCTHRPSNHESWQHPKSVV